jgi:nickel-type superoxide dismutase maturation protease
VPRPTGRGWRRRSLALALAALSVVLGLRGASRLFARVEVHGSSMTPTLQPGDRLLARRAGRRLLPFRVGDLVLVTDPGRPGRTVVKRLAALTPAGAVVLGDNRLASTDSRTYGPVATSGLRGKVVYRYAPSSRAGRLPGPWIR